MKNGLFKKWLTAALCVLALGSTAALAEPDTFYLGTGRTGTFTVVGSNNVINSYGRVTNAPAAKEDFLQVDSVFCSAPPCFAVGDLVMVLQTTGIVPEPDSGDTGATNISDKPVGRWELARLKTVSGSGSTADLTLTAPLVYSYTSNVTQVIRVPEYIDLTIDTGATLKAQAWNGRIGGVLAFLAQGKVINNGTITASGAGFRGGVFVRDSSGKAGCFGNDEPAQSGAQRGEGLASLRYGTAQTGRGNVANGGGGGVCVQSGGGGGGNGGAGGQGGFTSDIDSSRNVGGLGGTVVLRSTRTADSLALIDRLILGGGGGAGHGTDPSGTAGGSGGAGGGIIFIRAGELQNAIGSSFTAAGAAGGAATTDGAGGGGAGGDIYLRVARSITCASTTTRLSVSGGSGGSVSVGDYVGPGGGGGAGRILLQAESVTCGTSTLGASPGSQLDPGAPGGAPYGATAGGAKAAEIISSSFAPPAPPTVVSPANNSFTNNVRPPMTGTGAPASSRVYVYVDGIELGWTTSDASGNWSFTPTADIPAGAHQVRAVAEALGVRSNPSAANTFTVDLKAPEAVIVSGPASLVNSRNATFDLDVKEADTGVVYECKLSPATAFTTCSDPAAFTVPADGPYTLVVRARDAAGNVGPETTPYAWTVDTVAPEAEILSGPPSVSNSRNATFDLDVKVADTGVVYECKLSPATTFTSCADPANFTVPADGSYTLVVRARDAAGNVGPETAPYAWTVDTKAPDARIVSGPSSLSTSRSATFDLDVVEPDTGVTYECRLLPIEATFTPCTDPANITVPADGLYTLEVIARDAANNVDASPATYTWTVDTVAPAAPVVESPAPNGTVDTLTPVIRGTAEPHSTVTVIIDGVVVGTVPADASGNWSYTPTSPLELGEHRVQVRATDEAGNTGPTTPDSHTFTVAQDTSAPETAIDSGPSDTTSERTATFEFSSNEPGVTYECSLDGAPFTPCTSPVTFTNLADGEHTFRVRARDAAGNVDASPAGRTWTVDPNAGGDVAFLGDGIGCSASGGDASWLLMGLGTFLTLSRRRRRN
ncbi:MAG TPA: Ig-like domain-containing protein [Archangium sp.]|uniref:adventurous gliding motility protein AgmC n=1 Tax=Archangium sp. TaxID=1872627 RepID=UPI002E36D524|nr:Ig-like domain-containing protein [Archangium sp.]HEX5749041.1 Ig-like domain-containing protein [Archangium sp.]